MLNGFAVFDLETTGLRAKGQDRVIEVGVVLLDREGRFEYEFATLLNPNRDVGPAHIHGVRAKDLWDAPTFEQIAPELAGMFTQRMLVAHNLSFDSAFLAAEFERIGTSVDIAAWPSLCTMLLAGQCIDASSRSLAAACAACGIPNDRPHEALSDAQATAELLQHMISANLDNEFLHLAMDVDLPDEIWPDLEPREFQVRHRNQAEAPSPSMNYLAAKVESLKVEVATDAEREFLATLDLVLADEVVTPEESQDLLDAAVRARISTERLQTLRELYFQELTARVWSDGKLDEMEEASLRRVGDLMRIGRETLDAALRRPQIDEALPLEVEAPDVDLVLQPGDLVVLTGDMELPRQHYVDLLARLGLSVWPTVTKKVRLVIAADPFSLSGKAKRAREIGTPIVSIGDFLEGTGLSGS